MDAERREETTAILGDLAQGDGEAANRLMPLVYDELRSMADGYFRNRPPGQTLQPTAVVHEAYLRMVDQTAADYRSRNHFIAVAATAMRQILVDHARRRMSQKRGGDRERVMLHESLAVTRDGDTDLLALDEALTKLETLNERMSKIIGLRFFGGMSIQETADALGVARVTITEDWRMARAWLACELQGENERAEDRSP